MTVNIATHSSPTLERLVTYFGLDEDGKPSARRFLVYKIIAMPGPAEDAGLAMIDTLAVNNFNYGCDYCQRFHTVLEGGASAAMAAAIHHLDSHYRVERVHKVESNVRSCDCGTGVTA